MSAFGPQALVEAKNRPSVRPLISIGQQPTFALWAWPGGSRYASRINKGSERSEPLSSVIETTVLDPKQRPLIVFQN
jgi:hypothetical protein